MHDSITFATPFHPKNDLENRPFRASYISTRSQRRLSGKFGHEMGGDRCRGRWILRILNIIEFESKYKMKLIPR